MARMGHLYHLPKTIGQEGGDYEGREGREERNKISQTFASFVVTLFVEDGIIPNLRVSRENIGRMAGDVFLTTDDTDEKRTLSLSHPCHPCHPWLKSSVKSSPIPSPSFYRCLLTIGITPCKSSVPIRAIHGQCRVLSLRQCVSLRSPKVLILTHFRPCLSAIHVCPTTPRSASPAAARTRRRS